MSLTDFIRSHHEQIIVEFAAFAKTLMPPGVEMTDVELRDHAREILTAVVDDMNLAQTSAEQHRKSQGLGIAHMMEASGRLHAADRIKHGYTFEAVLAEFRALRASVLRLYEETGATDLKEVRRFNEAIDEALTESMHQFSHETDLLQEELEAKAEKNTSLLAEIRDRRATEDKIRALFLRLVSMQDEERRRLSRDLHDHVGQHLTALRMTIASLERAAGGPSSQGDDLGRARQLVEDIDRSLHALTWELRPADTLEHHGLAMALASLVAGWSERFGIAAEFQAAEAEMLQLSPAAAANVYGLVQEALHNIAKHADARHVGVVLQARDDEAVVIVEDDGRGFDPEHALEGSGSHGLGLLSMRERASLCSGALEIDTAPGRGTTIFARIPLATDSGAPRA